MKKALVMVMVLMLTAGCAGFGKWSSKEEPSQPATGPTLNQAFFTFPDIAVPQELSFQRDKSFIYETSSVKAGVMRFGGNVEMGSLETYFRTNMAKNGWRFVNSYKTTDIILNFVKDDRSSNIRIAPGTFSNSVEIWVGPLDRGAAAIDRGTAPGALDRGTAPAAIDRGSVREEPIYPPRR
jgi:hypothetical protein